MTRAESLPNEELIFDAAIQIADTAQRSAYLDEACAGDKLLRSSVEQLLACHDSAGDFLESPPPGATTAHPPLPVPAMVGVYRLIERIGEGGFGIVYRAEQQEPVRREVAVKIIRHGMESSQIIARFEAERQALAMMRHPNIATVLDAGRTSDGWPYFVMELVDGRPIDEYCDAEELDINARLQLFVSVCRAVQHAHHKGIVHRDLKPSNVLITLDDARPVPKVIDFGVAKAMRGSEHDSIRQSGDTQLRQLVGTPEYMSPEQVSGLGDVDTRADIYALGGMLYTLFTGVAPPDTEAMRHAGFDEICRMIREQTPPRPSLRLSCLAERVETLARQRATTPLRLRRTLSRDLDWIVMKAMEKERSRRYETASELARDIERYLDHEPVSAGPPSVFYRAHKFVRRNRTAVGAAVLIALTVTLGGIFAAIGFVRAERERRYANEQWARAENERSNANAQRARAETEREKAAAEAEKSQRVVDLLEQMISAAHPERGHRADYTVRDLLDDFAGSLDGQLRDQPLIEANMRRTIGRAFWSLGNTVRAGPQLERALDLRKQLYGEDHALTAQSAVDLGLYLMQVSRLAEAEQLIHAVLPTLKRAGPGDELAWAYFVLSRVRHEFGDRAESEQYAAEAWATSRSIHGAEHPTALLLQGYFALQRRGEEDSEALARDALDRMRAVRPAEHVDVATLQRVVARVIAEHGQLEEAERLSRAALAADRKLLGEESSHVVQDLLALADVLKRAARSADSEKVAREAVQLAERVTVDQDLLRVRANKLLASVLEQRDPAGELDALAAAIESSRRVFRDDPQVAALLRQRGVALMQICRVNEAVECLREAWGITRNSKDKMTAQMDAFLLGHALHELGELDQAVQHLLEVTEQIETLDGPPIHVELIEMLVELGRTDEAEEQLESMTALADRSQQPYAPASVMVCRALVHMGKGDLSAAEPLLRDAIGLLRGTPAARARLRTSLTLAACLTAAKRFEDAERVLADLERRTRNPRIFRLIDQYRVARAFARLYETWDKPAQAERWRQRAIEHTSLR